MKTNTTISLIFKVFPIPVLLSPQDIVITDHVYLNTVTEFNLMRNLSAPHLWDYDDFINSKHQPFNYHPFKEFSIRSPLLMPYSGKSKFPRNKLQNSKKLISVHLENMT